MTRHANYSCSRCRRRFHSAPAARDHVYDAHPNRVTIILKKYEVVCPDEEIVVGGDDPYEQFQFVDEETA